jgi:hypothetical protein
MWERAWALESAEATDQETVQKLDPVSALEWALESEGALPQETAQKLDSVSVQVLDLESVQVMVMKKEHW